MIQHPYITNYFQQPTPQPLKQQNGFVVVATEADALRYPIAPGNSITFKIESEPVMIEKTMGFSQLETPTVKRFRIVEEDSPKEVAKTPEGESEAFQRQSQRIDAIEAEIEKIKALLPKRTTKKKEEDDE